MSSTTGEPVSEKMTTNQVDAVITAPLEHGVHVVKRVHQDGTVDFIDAHAVGGDFEEMPTGYFLTPNFIFTFIVRFLTLDCLHVMLIPLVRLPR
jgi:hypothetical protein